FPGETDDDFEATCDVLREVGFAKVHVFSFSPRSGTPAATLPDQVPAGVVAERRQRLLAVERETQEEYLQSLIGRTLDVLVEAADSGRPGDVLGTSCRYVPVRFEGHLPALLRRRVTVRAERAIDGVIEARPEFLPTAALSRMRLSDETPHR